MKEIQTYEVIDSPGVYHIPGVHNMQITLCGFVDVSSYTEHFYDDKPCNCVGCIEAYNRIKNLKFPKGYFATE